MTSELPVLLAPFALMLATVVVAGRARGVRRQRALNRALHELRRPLQALALGSGADLQVRAAIVALADLDREINGGPARPPARTLIEARELARDAVERWREPALRLGRRVELRWYTRPCPIVCEPDQIARALDNLIANSLEHGSGPIVLEGTTTGARVRLHVADGGPGARGNPPGWERRDSRHGYGTGIVAAAASCHGGRFATCRGPRGGSAVIELPLAPGSAPAA